MQSIPPTINTLARGTYLLSNNTRAVAPFVTPTDEGALTTSTEAAKGFTNLSITGGFNLGGGGNTPAEYDYTMVQVSDSVDMIRGPHQIAFGVDFIHGNAVYYNTQYSNGQFAFDGSQTGYGLLDFLLWRVATLQQGADVNRHERSSYIGFFAQDTWKVNRRLTLNAGLRWDPFLPINNQNGQVLQFNPANFTAGKVSSVFTSAPAGLIFPGDSQYADGNSETSSHLANFAPRVGLVIDPRGQGKETIRAGYGVFFDSPPMFDYVRIASVAPWGTLQVTLNSIQFSNPYANYAGGNPFPVKVSPTESFPTQATYWEEPAKVSPTYMQQWNISFQKQFFTSFLATISYLGNKTTHLWDGQESNPAIYFPGTCAAGQYGLTVAGTLLHPYAEYESATPAVSTEPGHRSSITLS